MKRAILVCDSSRGRLFASTGRHEPLRLLHTEDFAAGRAREHDLRSDQPGRYSEGGKHGNLSALEPHTSAHEIEAERFARHLADIVARSHARGEYESIAVAAPAHFLGLLRAAVAPAIVGVATWLAKDLSKLEPGELMEHVGPVLWPGS